MHEKRKILFVLPTLSAGGAERIISFLAQNIDPQVFKPHLLIVGKTSDAAYSFENEKTTFLNKDRVLTGIPLIIVHLIKYKPNVVISSIGHLNTVFGLLAPLFPHCKFIIREASVISVIAKFKKGKKIFGMLPKLAYKNIDIVVCQSQDMANDFLKLYKLNPEKLAIISNPITEEFPVKIQSRNEVLKFITIGRLSKEKGHDRLLDVLAKIQYPYQYTIIGSGPEETNIRNKIIQLGLDEKVDYIPYTNKIGEELSRHDVFLQGSYVEGFPNAVLESLVVGTPVIAFNAPGGTKEIIHEGLNGHIVENIDDFTNVLRLFPSTINQWNPIDISNSVKSKFSKGKILRQYEDLFLNI